MAQVLNRQGDDWLDFQNRLTDGASGPGFSCNALNDAIRQHVLDDAGRLSRPRRMMPMTIDELETAALRLEPEARARLAERLLESLENLSEEESARLWAEEAERRSAAWDAGRESGRPAEAVFRDLKSRLS
jgi:hypothetical protein